MLETYISDSTKKMQNNLDSFCDKIQKIRTGKVQTSILDGIQVFYYGKQQALTMIANISVPSARMIVINPWDVKSLKDIEQALSKSHLGIHPQNDGKLIRLIFPELTEDRRKDLVKEVKKQAEKSKVDLRNNRRIVNDTIKREVKNKEISEDQEKQLKIDIQKITDDFIEKVHNAFLKKEKEILEI